MADARRAGMKKIVGLAILAASLSTGCLVHRHGHVAVFPPPGLLIAGAIAASIAQPGRVWIEGHWDWTGDRWVWTDGMWIADQPGFVWIQGGWYPNEGRYYFRPGHWRRR